MSVISKNPFDLLGDDGDESPAPAAKAAPKKADAPAAPARAVPGAGANKPANAGGAGAQGGDRPAGRGGRYPNRGAPRNVYRNEGDRNTGPTSSEGVAEGMETPGGFDGERVAPSRKGNHIRDAHTKGPRGSRPAKNYTSGGHTSSRGGLGGQGAHTPAQGGERRQFERRSGGIPDSQKKVDQGWGANEGEAELTAEVEGERDAVVEENTPETPAPEGVEADDVAAAVAEPAEPEEVQKGLDEYLAERASAAFEFGKKEGRQVNAETLEGSQFRREGIDEFFSGKKDAGSKAPKASAKKEKVYIEFDGQFATPPGGPQRGGDRPFRGGDRGGERGRGGGGGERGGRGRGAPRGAGAGRGGPRGGSGAGAGGRGGRGGQGANLDSSDQTAFPALGA